MGLHKRFEVEETKTSAIGVILTLEVNCTIDDGLWRSRWGGRLHKPRGARAVLTGMASAEGLARRSA